MAEKLEGWNESAIVVVPGLPGQLSAPDGAQGLVYPASTLTVVKRLRLAGYAVETADPGDIREVSHHSTELWLPIINFGLQVLANGAGSVLADVLMLVIQAPRRSKHVHVDWGVQRPDGAVHRFRFDGDGEAAVETAKMFAASLEHDDDAE